MAETTIEWAGAPAPNLTGLTCPTCAAPLIIIGGVVHHPGYTFNPWWGCTKVSEGCANCYAEAWDRRVGGDHWGPGAERRFLSDAHWRKPLKWNRHAEELGVRLRVFCASMADVFEDRPELVDWRLGLWRLIYETPHLDWLLLTKRPENFATMLPWARHPLPGEVFDMPWGEPRPNVWLGVTAENQQRADERLPLLRDTPAVKRFASYEPAVGPVDFTPYLRSGWSADHPRYQFPRAIDWLIAGAESRRRRAISRARLVPGCCHPMHVRWGRVLHEAALHRRPSPQGHESLP